MTPWNFPVLLSLNPTVQALVAGNAVLLKPSEVTPFSGRLVEELFREAGLPEGVLQVLLGDGETGAALVEAGVDKISFTGSVATGRKVAEACARQLLPCTLELGGKVEMHELLEHAGRREELGQFFESIRVVAGLFDELSHPALEGRLRCQDGDSGEPSWAGSVASSGQDVLNVFPEELDDTPLWEFILPGANAEVVGGVCLPNMGNPPVDRAQMLACLDGWKAWSADPNNGPHTLSLFSIDILNSPRFAAVPILDADPSLGVGAYQIDEFVPAYLEAIYLNCSGTTCNLVFSPGEASSGACPNPLTANDSSCGWPGFGNTVLEAVTSYILTVDMLDPIHQKFFPGRPGTVVYNLLD
jgi:hypothetical protein